MDPGQHCTGSPMFQMGFKLSSSLFRLSFFSFRAQHPGRQLSGALISGQGNSSSGMLLSPYCILEEILSGWAKICLLEPMAVALFKGGDPSKANFEQYFPQRVLSEIPRFGSQLFFKFSIDMILLFVDPYGLQFLIVFFHLWTHAGSGC